MARLSPQPLATAHQILSLHATRCDACALPLHVGHSASRTIRRLDGVWGLTLLLWRCLNPQCLRFRKLCRPEEEGTWALPHGEFGFDVIALVGHLRFAQHRSIPEIHQSLHERGVAIAECTVTNLLARYEELLALQFTSPDHFKDRFLTQGHVILGLDGLKPDVGHEVLWVLRDCISGDVLLARSLLSECEEEVADLIRDVQAALPVPIIGVISDGQRSIRCAVAAALPGVPHQLCHYHYVREAAKPIYEADLHAQKELQQQVRGVRPIERALEGVLRQKAATTGVKPARKLGVMEPLTPDEVLILQSYCHAIRSALTDDGQPPCVYQSCACRNASRLSSLPCNGASSTGTFPGVWRSRLNGCVMSCNTALMPPHHVGRPSVVVTPRSIVPWIFWRMTNTTRRPKSARSTTNTWSPWNSRHRS